MTKNLLLQLILAALCSTTMLGQEVKSVQPQLPKLHARFTLAPYRPSRVGSELLPVEITGVGGGKLRAADNLKLYVSGLKNKTAKAISSLRFSCYVFNSKDLNVVLDTRQTQMISIDLQQLENRHVEIHILDADDVPLLLSVNSPNEVLALEVAVTEVHYVDGTTWQADDLPQTIDPAKLH